jgi:hypothetical protein
MQLKLGQREAALTTWRSLLPPDFPATGDATAYDAAVILRLCDPRGELPRHGFNNLSPLSELIIRHLNGYIITSEEQAALDFLTAPVTDGSPARQPTDETPPGDDTAPAPVKNP